MNIITRLTLVFSGDLVMCLGMLQKLDLE